MTEQDLSTETMNFKDRKTGLVIFGVAQLILGIICAIMVPFMILAATLSAGFGSENAAAGSPASMIPVILMYSLLAAWFVIMGIGSIRARRWARALTLVSSWLWLVCSLCGMFFMALILPEMIETMSNDQSLPNGMETIMTITIFGFMAVFYIIIPGAQILFYGSRHVKATCESRDPHIRWTDRCPLPVLAMCLMFGAGAIWMPSMGIYGWAFPFFGIILSGLPGAALAMGLMGLSAYIAWGSYTLRLKSWWSAVILIVTLTISWVITFSRISMMEYYEKMNIPPQQLENMEQFSFIESPFMIIGMVLWMAVGLGYLFFIRKYFPVASENSGSGDIKV